MTTLVFGASAGVGRALCRAFAARGERLVVISRDAVDLEAESAHCTLSYGVPVDWLAVDASDSAVVGTVLRDYLSHNDVHFDNLMFPLGGAASDDRVDGPNEEIIRALNTNLISIMVSIGILLPRMTAGGRGNIVGFGSIAALRGRTSLAAYAAAKRGLESYFESLRHAVATRGIAVQFYRLGYVATQQSYGKKLLLPAIPADTVARYVLANLNRDIGLRSLPRYWSAVGLALRLLPWRVYRRLNF